MNERRNDWKPVPEFEDYQINSQGFLRKKVQDRQGNEVYFYMKYSPSASGYVRYCLTKNRRRRVLTALRLVMEVFAPREDMSRLEVNHIDSDKMNNTLENGEWLTHQQNCAKNINLDKPRSSKKKGIWIIYKDDRIEYYRRKKDCNIPNGTLTHLLVDPSYSNQSIKYNIKACFYEDCVPERWKATIEEILNDAVENKMF